MTHDFHERLAYSHAQSDQPWWETVYTRAFPSFKCMVDVRADGWAQRAGIDRYVHLHGGKILKVDEKVREKDWGDIALEFWSDEQRRKPGWVAKPLDCDYIAYAVEPTQVCYLLPFQTLRSAWKDNCREWVRRYPRVCAPNNGYQTISVGVPPDVLFSAMTDASIVSWADG